MKNRQSLTLYCYQQLHNTILSGRLLPGTKLKIHELKTTYGVGATPVREALSRLTATGLVEAVENRGFRVVYFSEAKLRDLMNTYVALELLILEQSINNGDEAWEANIMAALYRLEKIESSQHVDYLVWARYCKAFQEALVSGCKLQKLLKIRNDLDNQIQGYRCMFFLFVSQKSMKLGMDSAAYRMVASLAIERKASAVVDWMRESIEQSTVLFFSTLKEMGVFDK